MTFVFIAILHLSRPQIIAIIRSEARDLDIPFGIALRLADAESDLDPSAIGYNRGRYRSRDLGLYQLNSRYASWYVWRWASIGANLADPRINSHVGLSYLRALYDVTGNWYDALCAYNSGLSTVMGGQVKMKTERYALYIVGADDLAPGVRALESGKEE